jgi:hypothetical protein
MAASLTDSSSMDMLKEVLDKSPGARRNQATKPTKTRFQIKKDFIPRHRS